MKRLCTCICGGTSFLALVSLALVLGTTTSVSAQVTNAAGTADIDEGEGCPGDNNNDTYNGGCNSFPDVFQDIDADFIIANCTTNGECSAADNGTTCDFDLGLCGKCTMDSDCESGFTCSTPLGICTANSIAGTTSNFDNYLGCTTCTFCDEDTDCPQGEDCDLADCAADDDCPGLQTCSGGLCSEGYCSNDGCAGGDVCLNSICTNVCLACQTCTMDGDCPAGDTCSATGFCSGPSGLNECPKGESCDGNGWCTGNCPDGHSCDVNGICTSGCPDSELCDFDSNVNGNPDSCSGPDLPAGARDTDWYRLTQSDLESYDADGNGVVQIISYVFGEPVVGCTVDADCPNPQTCAGNICSGSSATNNVTTFVFGLGQRDLLSCSVDADCVEGGTCDAGTCTDGIAFPPCTSDADPCSSCAVDGDCGIGETCEQYEPCTADHDCPVDARPCNGGFCSMGICNAGACTTDDDCPLRWNCVDDLCSPCPPGDQDTYPRCDTGECVGTGNSSTTTGVLGDAGYFIGEPNKNRGVITEDDGTPVGCNTLEAGTFAPTRFTLLVEDYPNGIIVFVGLADCDAGPIGGQPLGPTACTIDAQCGVGWTCQSGNCEWDDPNFQGWPCAVRACTVTADCPVGQTCNGSVCSGTGREGINDYVLNVFAAEPPATCSPNDPDVGPCNEANPGVGGCEEPDCCKLVCLPSSLGGLNPLCCEDVPLGWIQNCADKAIELQCTPELGQPTCIATGPDSENGTDGFLKICSDPYGSWSSDGFGGGTTNPHENPEWGDEYNPTGAPDNFEVTFTSGYFLFDRPNQLRELLANILMWTNTFLTPDVTLSRAIITPNVQSDTDGDNTFDTQTSEFTVSGSNRAITVEVTQEILEDGDTAGPIVIPAGDIRVLKQTHVITNDAGSAWDFVLIRAHDSDIYWGPPGDLGLTNVANDNVGTAWNTVGGDMFVYIHEDGNPDTAQTLSCEDARMYYGSKQGLDPDGGGPGPAFGYGTDSEQWDEYGVPPGWENYIAGPGYQTDGDSGPMPPGTSNPEDASVGLAIPLSIGGGATHTLVHYTTYGSTSPLGVGGTPPCPWDCDGSGDGFSNVSDLLALLGQYDPGAPGVCDGGESCDFDANGCVDVIDLLKLLGHYAPGDGMSCPQ